MYFENYNFHVFKLLFTFKVWLAFNREISVNLTWKYGNVK